MPIVKSITEIMKNFKSLYGFGGRCLKIRDVYMDFEPYFKVHNLVSVSYLACEQAPVGDSRVRDEPIAVW